jgi:hypothetical protein
MHVRCEYVCYELVFLVMWTTLLIWRPTQAHPCYVSREGRLPHAVSTHSPIRPLPPLSSPRLRPPHLSPRRDARYTSSLRRTPHHARRDVHHTSDSEIWRRRRDVAAAVVTMTRGGTQQWWRQRRWRLEEASSDDDDDDDKDEDDLKEEEEGSNHEVDAMTRSWRQAGSDEEFRSLRSDSAKVNGESRIWIYGMSL